MEYLGSNYLPTWPPFCLAYKQTDVFSLLHCRLDMNKRFRGEKLFITTYYYYFFPKGSVFHLIGIFSVGSHNYNSFSLYVKVYYKKNSD